jgi:hypothetical protein
MASLIFRIVDGQTAGDESKYFGKTGVGWVLRFGGLCTLVGQFICYSNLTHSVDQGWRNVGSNGAPNANRERDEAQAGRDKSSSEGF